MAKPLAAVALLLSLLATATHAANVIRDGHATSTTNTNNGLMFDECSRDNTTTCGGGLNCTDNYAAITGGGAGRCELVFRPCVCMAVGDAVVRCKRTSDCGSKQRCFDYTVTHTNHSTTRDAVCGSCTTQQTHFNGSLTRVRPRDDGAPNCPDDDDDGDGGGVCIAVDLLKHVPRDQLVYARHRRAAVLCDPVGNCATPGHMVLFHGAPMMMKSYCDALPGGSACRRSVALVNSPRMQRRLSIASKWPHLRLTALASRFQLRVEERVLAAAIRLGL